MKLDDSLYVEHIKIYPCRVTHSPTLGENDHLVQNTTATFCCLQIFWWIMSITTDSTDSYVL